MLWEDIFYETYSALSANKVRSGLTVLGIVIGISSVIAMLAIGQGAQSSIQENIQSIGSNLIIVMPGVMRTPGSMVSSGRGSAKSLTLADAEAIAELCDVVKAVAPEVSGRYQLTAKGNNTNTQVVGTVVDYPAVRNLQVELGSFVSAQNIKSASKVVVLGPTVRDDLFGDGVDPLGQTVRINGINFKVIGVNKEKGGSGNSSQDDMVFIPITTAQRYLSGDKYVTTISVGAIDSDSTTIAQTAITELLMKRHKISDESKVDFSTMNQADITSAATSVTKIFTILLGSVAGISLVVGGIGIMNMMLTTVTERTREIGLRKAIGAKRNDITKQFLVEAVSLTFLGGLLGVFLGWLVSFFIAYFDIIQTKVSWFSVILAFGVSAGIGVAFGYYPAKRASRLNPIEALRYE